MPEPVTYDSLAGLTRIEPKTHDERLASIATLVKFIDEQQFGSWMFRIGQIGLTLGQDGAIGYAKPVVMPEQFTLQTRGIFPFGYGHLSTPFVLGQQGQQTLWGLINGKWHFVTVNWVIKRFEGEHSPWPHATIVCVSKELTLQELLDRHLPDCDAKAIEYWLKEFAKRCQGLARDRLRRLDDFVMSLNDEERFWARVAVNAEATQDAERKRRLEAHAARYGG